MNYINLDFCIIENPLDKNKKPIIFVTRKGKQYLDETVINEDDYEKAIFIIQDIGYVESDILTFEFSQDPDFPNITSSDIKKMLEEKGMKYSIELEETMKGEFELFNVNRAKQFIDNLVVESKIKEKKRDYVTIEQMSLFNKKSRYKIPEIGKKLTLYFYLFIECRFFGEKCYLNLNGDFISNKNNELRNYLGVFKCDFIRINNVNNPNKIILKSCKTNQDILKKMPMDYGGSFNLNIKENNLLIDKLFVYYLMEVKNNFPLENRITIEIDSSYNFDQMIKMSKKIKSNYELTMKKNYTIRHVLNSFIKMIEILNPKMLSFADEDEFEKAAIIKTDIKYIKSKIKKISEIKEESIPYSEFLKTFHVN